VYAHAVDFTKEAENWYAVKRRPKRWAGRWLRVGAILLGAVAAIVPLLAQIWTDNAGEPEIAPAWATVALVGAATLIALDRFLGSTAGWMRFMTVELRLSQLRHEFQYEWQALLLALPDEPSDAETLALVARAKSLVVAVDTTIQAETDSWTKEFRMQLEAAEADVTRARP
jgi:hypothetical protein